MPAGLMIAIFAITLLVPLFARDVASAGAGRNVLTPDDWKETNPVGVLLSGKVFGVERRAELAGELGVAFLREPVFLSSWDGTCSECPTVRSAGLEFVLTVRNSGDAKVPSAVPSNFDEYRDTVARVIDAYRPALVAVENEENSLTFYQSGAENYGSQLKVACEAAHAEGVPCTNGGLLSATVKYFVYQHHVDSGRSDLAASYANRAFESWQKNKLATAGGRAFVKDRAREVQRYLDAYSGSGVDFLNIHWYHVSGKGLEETVEVLREVTGMDVVSNETGQRNLDPGTTRAMLQAALDSGMPFVVWYGSDARLAKGLVDRDGSLRATGREFQEMTRSL
jgi:hypothetical protein